MTTRLPLLALAAIAAIAALAIPARLAAEDAPAKEAAEHPRLERSIHELQETITYLNNAPNDFGGHKADAIAACKEAIEQLKKALEFRAAADSKP